MAKHCHSRERLLPLSQFDDRRRHVPTNAQKRVGERPCLRIVVDPIGNPEHRHAALPLQHLRQRLRRRRPVRRVRVRLYGGGRRARLRRRLDLQRLESRHPRGRRNDDAAALRFCLGDQPLHLRGHLRPPRRRRPAIVDHDRNWPRPGHRRRAQRIEHGLSQSENQQRRRQHADQHEPPGSPLRLLLFVLQPDQNARRRKLDPLRRRWHRPQQPPDHRQRQQPEKQGRIEKRQSAHDGASVLSLGIGSPRSRIFSCSSVSAADRSVWCTTNDQPLRRARSCRPARCSASRR